MAKTETTVARSPRGTKPVAQAFFSALDSIPEAGRVAVAKAAQAMIRDQIKLQREKVKLMAAKAKAAPAKKAATSAEQPVMLKAAPKAKTAKAQTAKAQTAKAKTAPAKPASAKRRPRKTADVPAAAE